MSANPPPPDEDIGGLYNDGHWIDFVLVPLVIVGWIATMTICIWLFLGVWP